MRIRAGVVASAAIGMALAVAPAASADSVSVKIETQVPGQANYSGKVKTKRDACAKNRTVQVYDLSSGEFFVAQTTTDSKGNYGVTEYVPLPGEQIRVVVPAKQKGKGSCPGVEKTVTVPDSPAVP